jgi:hypothetical protein
MLQRETNAESYTAIQGVYTSQQMAQIYKDNIFSSPPADGVIFPRLDCLLWIRIKLYLITFKPQVYGFGIADHSSARGLYIGQEISLSLSSLPLAGYITGPT